MQGLEVLSETTTAEYLEFVQNYGDDAQLIPTMNLFTIKPNIVGNSTRAESRIIALGNLENWTWSREDQYALVISATASRLLTSMAADDGR